MRALVALVLGLAASAMLASSAAAESAIPLSDVDADRQKSLLQLMSRDRLWHKLWLAATPNESDWELMRLPASLSALYYVLRPFRLLRKYGRQLRIFGT